MELANFTQSNQDAARPAGTAELGGIPVHAFLDRSNPAAAWITIRSSMAERAPLVPRLQSVTAISVAGHAVAVRAVGLQCGASALQGQLDPALVEALAGPPADPNPNPAPAPPDPDPDPAPQPVPEPVPEPEADAGGTAPGSLVALSRQHDAAKAERAAHAARVQRLRSEAAELRGRLQAAERELAAAGDADAGHAERCAELRGQIRDLLDSEEA